METEFRCDEPLCDFQSQSKIGLKIHKRIHKRWPLRIPDKNGNRFPCTFPKCGYQGNRQIFLTAHISHCHNPERRGFSCPWCIRTARTKVGLQNHLKMHQGEAPPYLCTYCDYATTCETSIRNHLQRHKREQEGIEAVNVSKKHKCDQCDYTAPSEARIKLHARVHVQDRPFACSFPGCGYSAKWIANLEEHEERHDPVLSTRFGCPICPRRFCREYQLHRHVRTHTQEKTVKCPLCDYRAATLVEVKRHHKRHHQDRSSGQVSKCNTKKRTRNASSGRTSKRFRGSGLGSKKTSEDPKNTKMSENSMTAARSLTAGPAKALSRNRKEIAATNSIEVLDNSHYSQTVRASGTENEKSQPSHYVCQKRRPSKAQEGVASMKTESAPALNTELTAVIKTEAAAARGKETLAVIKTKATAAVKSEATTTIIKAEASGTIKIKGAAAAMKANDSNMKPEAADRFCTPDTEAEVQVKLSNIKSTPEEAEWAKTNPSPSPKAKETESKCAIRGDGSEYPSKMKLDMRVHVNDLPFACSMNGCSFRTKWESYLKDHIKRIHDHTRTIIYKCHEASCNFTADNVLSANRHRYLHPPKKSFLCPQCPKKYISKAGLLRHLKNHIQEGCLSTLSGTV